MNLTPADIIRRFTGRRPENLTPEDWLKIATHAFIEGHDAGKDGQKFSDAWARSGTLDLIIAYGKTAA